MLVAFVLDKPDLGSGNLTTLDLTAVPLAVMDWTAFLLVLAVAGLSFDADCSLLAELGSVTLGAGLCCSAFSDLSDWLLVARSSGVGFFLFADE